MMRQIINRFPLVTYTFYFELNAMSRDMLGMSFPANPIWKRISMFPNKWNNIEASSSSLIPTSQVSRT